jgi:hypothetical protein
LSFRGQQNEKKAAAQLALEQNNRFLLWLIPLKVTFKPCPSKCNLPQELLNFETPTMAAASGMPPCLNSTP